MTPHEKECALAALAARIEMAASAVERRQARRHYLEVLETPITDNDNSVISCNLPDIGIPPITLAKV